MRPVSNLSFNFGNEVCLERKTRRIAPVHQSLWRTCRAIVLCAAVCSISAIAEPADAISEPGISYTNDVVRSIPWSIHVLKIDRSRKDLAFFSAHAGNKVLSVAHLSEQARTVPPALGRAIAAVNGDFYLRDNPVYGGDPRGLQIMDGDLLSGPNTVCVWFDAQNNPHLDEVKASFQVTWPDGRKTSFGLNQQRLSGMMVLYTPSYGTTTRASGGREFILEKEGNGSWLPLGAGEIYRARVREVRTNGNSRLAPDTIVLSVSPPMLAGLPEVKQGSLLEVSTATTPSLKGVKQAIGGGPALIQDGKVLVEKTPPPGLARSYSERSKYERHPRSAIGWSPTHVYLVVVDGRQPELSAGMKLAELAEYMARLGCTEAMNLDGGKSSQLWMSGRMLNSPCQGDDTVANALLVVRKPAAK